MGCICSICSKKKKSKECIKEGDNTLGNLNNNAITIDI